MADGHPANCGSRCPHCVDSQESAIIRTGFPINRGACAIYDYKAELGYWLSPPHLGHWQGTAASSCRRKRWGRKKVHLTLHPSGTKESILVTSGPSSFCLKVGNEYPKGPVRGSLLPSFPSGNGHTPRSTSGATKILFLPACIKAPPVKRHVVGKRGTWFGGLGLLGALLSTINKDEACDPQPSVKTSGVAVSHRSQYPRPWL